jgi:hypothetical protein
LTHPVIAALDFPLCCAKREKKKQINDALPLCCAKRERKRTINSSSPSLPLAAERVDERSKSG